MRGESESSKEKVPMVTWKVVPIPRTPPPFPYRLVKKSKEGKYCRFVTMLKQHSINVTLIELLEQTLKFMKYILTMKRLVHIKDDDKLQHCSTIATRPLVYKKNILVLSLSYVPLGYNIFVRHCVILELA